MRVICSEGSLTNRQCSTVGLFDLCVTPLSSMDVGKVVEVSGDQWILRSEGFLEDHQRSPVGLLGLCVSTLLPVKVTKV